MNQKQTIIKIITSFLKAGTNVERDIYPKMKYRSLYMNDKQFEEVGAQNSIGCSCVADTLGLGQQNIQNPESTTAQ